MVLYTSSPEWVMKVNDSPSAPALPVLESNFYFIELSKIKIMCIQIVKFPLKQKNEEEKNFSIFSFEVMSIVYIQCGNLGFLHESFSNLNKAERIAY